MIPLYRAVTREAKRIRRLATLMRQLTVILTAVTVATCQTYAGSLDWLVDVVNNDNIAREQAPSFRMGWCAASVLSEF